MSDMRKFVDMVEGEYVDKSTPFDYDDLVTEIVSQIEDMVGGYGSDEGWWHAEIDELDRTDLMADVLKQLVAKYGTQSPGA